MLEHRGIPAFDSVPPCLPSVHPAPLSIVAISTLFTWSCTARVGKLYCPGNDCSRAWIMSVDLGQRRLFTHSRRPPNDGDREANYHTAALPARRC